MVQDFGSYLNSIHEINIVTNVQIQRAHSIGNECWVNIGNFRFVNMEDK